MSISAPVVNAFLDTVKEMILAIEQRNSQRTADRAADARRYGQILAIHPDFIRVARTNCGGLEPGPALELVVDVLLCIDAAQHGSSVDR